MSWRACQWHVSGMSVGCQRVSFEMSFDGVRTACAPRTWPPFWLHDQIDNAGREARISMLQVEYKNHL